MPIIREDLKVEFPEKVCSADWTRLHSRALKDCVEFCNNIG
jgi:hypothetical protein